MLTKKERMKNMSADKARWMWISHHCRGVSPRWINATHTSPRLPTYSTLVILESRASEVIRHRALSALEGMCL